MPVFYFDTEIDGSGRARDREGVSLPNIDAAKHEAVIALYGLARDIEPKMSSRSVRLFVRDRSDKDIFLTTLNLTVEDK